MVTLDCETERTDGVTFVRLYVAAEYRRRVRVENRLDGPVWPPRREGQPAAGWDGDTFEGVVVPDERLVAGYATPAPPADPPAAVVADEPAAPGVSAGPVGADGAGSDGTGHRTAAADGGVGDEPTPADVVRSLGDPVVPREAVTVPDAPDGPETEGRTDAGNGSGSGGATPSADGREADGRERPGTDDSESGLPGGDGTDESYTASDGAGTPASDGQAAFGDRPDPDGLAAPPTDAALVVPGAVRAWLRDVDRRLGAVERRQAADGADPDPTLQVAVAGDRRTLARVADRVASLAGRARAVERGAGGDGRR